MAEKVEKSNNIDARVAEARQQIGKMISSRRVGSGQRQQDIWDKTGLNATSQSRIESGTSNYGIDNLLTMLIGIDMLDSFMESIESSLASAEETRRRVKVVNVDPELANGNIPLGTQTFIALMEQDPLLSCPLPSGLSALFARPAMCSELASFTVKRLRSLRLSRTQSFQATSMSTGMVFDTVG